MSTEKNRMIQMLRGDPVGKDILGQDLYVGDVVLYGSTVRSGITLKAALIVRVKEREDSVVAGRRYPTISNPDLVVRSYVRNSVATYRYLDVEGWKRGHGQPCIKKSHCHTLLWSNPPEDLMEMVKQDRLAYIPVT